MMNKYTKMKENSQEYELIRSKEKKSCSSGEGGRNSGGAGAVEAVRR